MTMLSGFDLRVEPEVLHPIFVAETRPMEVLCEHCGSLVDVQVDASAGDQHYVEDCSVCSRPLDISVTAHDYEITGCHAARLF